MEPKIYTGKLSACILAGGYSSRMGADKAGIELNGRPLLHHVAQAVSLVAGDITVVLRPDQELDLPAGIKLARDDLSLPEGPLRGVVAGLEQAASELAVIVACDSPCIRPELLKLLAGRLTGQDSTVLAAVPEWEGRLQPLLAVYRTSCAGRLREICAGGEQSVIGALGRINFERLDRGALSTADPDGLSFFNVNSPEDLARLESLGRQPL